MKQKIFKLGLLGKKYLDTVVHLESFTRGETNLSTKVYKTCGGIFNILKANVASTIIYPYIDSQVEAIIVSESNTSTRSSIIHSLSQKTKPDIQEGLIDWLHVAYIDDLIHKNILNNFKTKISLDFCTLNPRRKYLDVINKASLIFDSRERKPLYKDVEFKTPLILHDKYGCECIIEGSVVYEGFTNPHDNIHVNGAGDIFAGIFISEYYNSTLENAVKSTSELTTKHIIKK